MEQSRPARILLIEDNEGDAFLLGMALDGAHFPHTLTTIRDGEEALAFLCQVDASSSSFPDLIFLDLNLPHVDGATLIDFLRTRELLQDVPVVLLSSSRSPKDAARVAELRKSTFMIKPSDLDAFLDLGNQAREFLERCRESHSDR